MQNRIRGVVLPEDFEQFAQLNRVVRIDLIKEGFE